MTPGVDPRFAHRALARRCERGWTVEELAARSGLTAKVLGHIEGGRPVTPTEAAAIASAFGVTVESMAGVR